MTDEIVARVARSARYRDVDAALVGRIATEEAARGGSTDAVVKRVKRRLHQAVGAFRGARAARTDRLLGPIRDAWRGDLTDSAFREACRAVLATHASTRERIAHLDAFFPPIWRLTDGPPRRLLDLGCGIGPLMLPWMGLTRGATYVAVDADERALATVAAFLELVDQPHEVVRADISALEMTHRSDVALLLKLAPTLERQDPNAVRDLLARLRARFAVLSFPFRSLGRRAKGMERTYRDYALGVAAELSVAATEAPLPGELVFVMRLADG